VQLYSSTSSTHSRDCEKESPNGSSVSLHQITGILVVLGKSWVSVTQITRDRRSNKEKIVKHYRRPLTEGRYDVLVHHFFLVGTQSLVHVMKSEQHYKYQ
jgi:hypothetical protein